MKSVCQFCGNNKHFNVGEIEENTCLVSTYFVYIDTSQPDKTVNYFEDRCVFTNQLY